MVFPFNFKLSAPGPANPFASPQMRRPSNSAPGDRDFDKRKLGNFLHPRRPPSPSLLPPLAKKRGWIPSIPEPSPAAAFPTSTSGYLDTPAKYRDTVEAAIQGDDIDEMVADLPPPKRRRTLTGSIVSTAMSAALIGTAVGLTVYRLWKDRSKHPEQLPPPPYEQGEWVPPKLSTPISPITPTADAESPAPRSKKNHHVAGRRTAPRHRKTVSRANIIGNSPPMGSSVPTARMPIPAQFNFVGADEPEVDVDDQMSWMGDRLAQLIAEGQRALGKEVVVMSEDQEEPVDDGADGWVEEEDDDTPSRRSRFSTGKGKQPWGPALPSLGSPRLGREASLESEGFTSASFMEDESVWQTEELRESMERARMRYQRNRA
ncbi:hypothetical protein BKA93DRAFT_729892 [Sparassis latifolia]